MFGALLVLTCGKPEVMILVGCRDLVEDFKKVHYSLFNIKTLVSKESTKKFDLS